MLDTTFKKSFEMLLQYYKENGSLSNIKAKDIFVYEGKEYKIGVFIMNLRTLYKEGKLSNDQITKFESLGMIWKWKNKSMDFNTRIEPLIAYYKEFGTIANIPYSATYNYNGSSIKIGSLIAALRGQYKARKTDSGSSYRSFCPLSDTEVEILEELGMVWDANNTNFEYYIAPLVAYYNEFGTIKNIKPNSVYTYNAQTTRVGKIVVSLRRKYNLYLKNPSNDFFTKEQIELLDKMGMVWDNDDKLKRIEPLITYYNIHGSLNALFESKEPYYQDGVDLNRLIYNLRVLYRARFYKNSYNRVLSDTEVQVLESMGFEFEPKIYQFKYLIAPLVSYYKESGSIGKIKIHDIYVYKGKRVKIGKIISYLRVKYKARSNYSKNILPLNDEQVETLESMGMIWNISMKVEEKRRLAFKEKMKPLIAYYNEFGSIGDIRIKDVYQFDDKSVHVGHMIAALRDRYFARDSKDEKNALNDEEVAILEKMGIEWDIRRATIVIKLNILEDFYNKNGNIAKIRVNDEFLYRNSCVDLYYVVHSLNKLYRTQRELFKEEEIEKLNSMGAIFNKYERK